jgi:amidase
LSSVSGMTETTWLDATAQADLVRRGQVSPKELAEAAVARIEAVNPQLDAVIRTRFDAARLEADGDLPDGPFRGVPILYKDLGCTVTGEPTAFGLGPLREMAWPVTSYLAEQFRAAGFVPLGRTNVPELGTTVTTEPRSFPPARNPWNPGHSTGGSSGGSAAAVAAGLVPVAHANDGGGSIRIPASECGVVGLKPTRGG